MQKTIFSFLGLAILIAMLSSCSNKENKPEYLATLMTADPGHFHAALVQKIMYPDVDPQVYIFAPEGPDVADHLNRIKGFNERETAPTHWESQSYQGSDFFETMLERKPGNVLVLAGNNQKKTEYILEAIKNGINVYSDKPMAINTSDFELLKEAFAVAEAQGLLLYDIMSERFEINSVLQKALTQIPEVFGAFEPGTPEDPGVVKESVHHFFKYVSGNKIKRPPWFFDVEQEGDGIVDVTTHLVDLVQWACYPEVILDYRTDIKMLQARRWPTDVSPSQFEAVTRLSNIPAYLHQYMDEQDHLQVFANGEMVYKLKEMYARVKVEWKYEAPEGTGDTHYSIIKGSLADLEIRQGAEEAYRPELYILPHQKDDQYLSQMKAGFSRLAETYPGLELIDQENRFKVFIPDTYRIGHEAHFGQVTEKFISYLKAGKLPEWEVPNCLAKYYTTTAAFELAKK